MFSTAETKNEAGDEILFMDMGLCYQSPIFSKHSICFASARISSAS